MINPAVSNERIPTLIRWLGRVLGQGIGAGLVTGVALLAVDTGLLHLLRMQPDSVMAGLIYFQVCAQVGASTALGVAACLEGAGE